MPTSNSDPASDLTPDQRREQVAAILARGLLRTLQQSAAGRSRPAVEIPGISPAGLELPPQTRLSVSRRIGG